MSQHKLTALHKLGRKRVGSCPAGYFNVGSYHDGAYETEFVSPYTKSACNLFSPIVLLLQDWLSNDKLSGPLIADAVSIGRIPSLPTNRNLDSLLDRHFSCELSDVFATNLFPYIKPAGLSAAIPQKLLRIAGV